MGAGYVGLVTAACLAEVGNSVVVFDNDALKISQLKFGVIPIFEPGLSELVERNSGDGRLGFTDDLAVAVSKSEVLFIAVGTPPSKDGTPDISGVLDVASRVGKHMVRPICMVIKSTVPVGTSDRVRATISDELERRGESVAFSVISNPEFLKEGSAVNDFMRPDRILVGANNEADFKVMREIYEPFQRNRPCLMEMDARSVELSKYAANAMLASRISFMNEMSRLAELVGADIEKVRAGIGSDPRIGRDFLYAGCGYGGSCFPKDIQALLVTAAENGCDMELLKAVARVNEVQKTVIFDKIMGKFGGNIEGLDFAIWGLTFKPDTDDLRESPSIRLITGLLESGARVNAFDPAGNRKASVLLGGSGNFNVFDDMYEALKGCSALVLVTEWKQFRSPDFELIKTRLTRPLLFDGRNQWDPDKVRQLGFEYSGIGRP